MNSLVQQQITREEDSIEIGHKRYHDRVRDIYRNNKDKLVLKPELDLLKRDAEKLANRIQRFANVEGRAHPTVYKLRRAFKMMDSYELAYMTMRQCFNQVGIKKLSSIQNQGKKLGKMVVDHLNYNRFKEAMPGYLHVVENKLAAATQVHRHKVISRALNYNAETVMPIKWNGDLQRSIGVKLLSFFVEECGTFYIIKLSNGHMRNKKFKKMYYLQITPEAKDWLEKYHDKCSWLKPFKLPMVVKPVAWDSPYNGGYVSNDASQATQLLKMKINKRSLEINKRLREEKPDKLYKGINLIQDTPWQINKEILEVIETFIDGDIAGIPHKDIRMELPPKPWASDAEFDEMVRTQPDTVKVWSHRAAAIHDTYHRTIAKRVAFLHQVSIAKSNKDYQELYFPLTCDWRTRSYPEPWFLHPQSDDVGRGLLKFAKGKAVFGGTSGSFWLKVHAANCYGKDKESFYDRVKWVTDNRMRIRDAAILPYDNLWWTDADKPFQFLAVCFELNKLWQTGVVDSYVPVQMDGTCNGLQNFSMLMRDEIGGAAVNLVNHDKPADIYTQVLNETMALVKADCSLASENWEVAKAWMKAGITRKLVKRNVMTLPYGASEFGFTEQLVKEVNKLGTLAEPYLPDDMIFNCCRYLARINRVAIGRVVVKSVICMDWLQELTKQIANAGYPIKWTTPLRVTVEQKNMKQKLKRVKTYWGEIRIYLGVNKDTDKLHTSKMSNGIAPNLIHSLDASHLLLTVLNMADRGLTDFSMIHDSYGVHACDVDVMQECIRESFVGMYQEDLLTKFFKDVTRDLPAELIEELPAPPKLGSLVLSEVLDSDYFFA